MATSLEISIGRFLAVFAAAAVSLLLAVASPARSEVTDGGTLAPVAPESAPIEEAPPVESAPVEAAEAPAPPAPAPAPDPAAPAPAPDPAANLIPAEAAESAAATVAASVDSAARQAASNLEEVNRVDTPAAKEVTTAVTGAIPSGRDRDPQPIVHEVLKRQPAAKQLSDLGSPALGSSGQGVPAAVETQSPATGIVSGPGHDTSNSQTPGFLGSPPDDRPARQPIEKTSDDLFLSYLTGPTGESPRLVAAAGSIDLQTTLEATVGSTRSSSAPAPNPPADRSPLDGPRPAPGSSGEATPAPGGSLFVPLAALLALLALVAPATLRRFREVPDLPAPTLFVCALERPG